MTASAAPGDTFRAARDELLDLRGQHARAVEEFTFPDVGDTWSWAVDWFDSFARGNERPGLVVVEEDGSSVDPDLRRDRPPLRPDRRAGCATGGWARATP